MSYIGAIVPLFIGIFLVAFPRVFLRAKGPALESAMLKLRQLGFLLISVAAFQTIGRVGEFGSSEGSAKEKAQRVMHRVQAETPGGSGWYLGESTDGSFQVQLPIPFNDFTLSVTDPEGKTTKVWCIGAQSSEGIKFSAVEVPFIPGAPEPDFEKMPQSLGQGIGNFRREPYAGWPSVSFSLTTHNSGAYVRHVRTPASMIILTLEYPTERREDAALVKSRFLDSLKFTVTNMPGLLGGGQPFRLLTNPVMVSSNSIQSP